MSGVHKEIILEALAALPIEVRDIFSPYQKELEKSSYYPDIFAGISLMSEEQISEVDPDARRFIYPEPPTNEFQKKIDELSVNQERFGVVPLKSFYLISHYLNNAVESLRNGDNCSATKFCGVYSHVIADICEPIHALNPDIVDMVLPPPPEHIGLELHGGVEKLKADVNIEGYKPALLGDDFKKAEMSAYVALERCRDVGKAQTVPIVQALYSNNREEATRLSSIAQNESAKAAADFMYTVASLASENQIPSPEATGQELDLREYPFVDCEIDMLYRYRPMVDISLIPYSGGKSNPLSLWNASKMEAEKVQGLGVVPFVGPISEKTREATIEYLIVPEAYQVFSAKIGCNPLFENSIMPVVFKVFGDDRELYSSPEIYPKDKAIDIEVELNGTRWLKLSMSYVGHPTYDQIKSCANWSWPSHGVWANPVLK